MSPTIFKYKNYRFFFFSREEQRLHVHVVSPKGEAKFWIEPNIEVGNSVGFTSKEINKLMKIVKERSDDIKSKWKDHFGG